MWPVLTSTCLFGSILWIFVTVPCWGKSLSTEPARKKEEFCHYETFSPKCQFGEVLLIHEALYGRMEIGRCVKTNFGYVGCFVDVLTVLDMNCSGRRSCTMEVMDPSFGTTVPCNEEFKNYLSVIYSCVKVPTIDETTCSLSMTRAGQEVVPGAFLQSGPCGTLTRPLRVQVNTGQRINMTLLDFHSARASKNTQPHIGGSASEVVDMPPICYSYGLVVDGEPPDNLQTHFRNAGRDICRTNVRESLVITSTSRVLLLRFSSDKSLNFALRFTAVGCPQLKAPPGAWVTQNTSQAKVGCKLTKRVWHVVCQGNQWVGDVGNCTDVKGKNKQTNVTPKFPSFSLSSAWTSLVALGVAIIIGLVILIVGLFCWRRLRRKERKPRCDTTENTPMYQIAASQNMDTSDGEMDLLSEQQRTPCLYCRAASEHYAPFHDMEKTSTILPRQAIYGGGGARTLERHIMPPDLYSCNLKNSDEDERIKILSDLNVAYDRLPQTFSSSNNSGGGGSGGGAGIGSSGGNNKPSDGGNKAKESREQHRVLSDI